MQKQYVPYQLVKAKERFVQLSDSLNMLVGQLFLP